MLRTAAQWRKIAEQLEDRLENPGYAELAGNIGHHIENVPSEEEVDMWWLSRDYRRDIAWIEDTTD